MTVSIANLWTVKKTQEHHISHSFVIEKSECVCVWNCTYSDKTDLKGECKQCGAEAMVKACSADCGAECTNVAKAPLGEQLPNWINMIKLICLIH